MEDLSLSTLIWLQMARFVQNSNQVSNEYLRQFGITVAQFEALAHIRNFQPITQSDLAAGLTVSGGGISRMLARLEREGLIRREQEWKTRGRGRRRRLLTSGSRTQGSRFPRCTPVIARR